MEASLKQEEMAWDDVKNLHYRLVIHRLNILEDWMPLLIPANLDFIEKSLEPLNIQFIRVADTPSLYSEKPICIEWKFHDRMNITGFPLYENIIIDIEYRHKPNIIQKMLKMQPRVIYYPYDVSQKVNYVLLLMNIFWDRLGYSHEEIHFKTRKCFNYLHERDFKLPSHLSYKALFNRYTK